MFLLFLLIFWLKRGSSGVVIWYVLIWYLALFCLCLVMPFFPLRGSTNGWGVVLASVMLFRGSICVFSFSLMMTCLLSNSSCVLFGCYEVRPDILTSCLREFIFLYKKFVL